MLTLIGMGLCDVQDLTLRGRAAIEEADQVYLEGYTSLLRCSVDDLSVALGMPIRMLSREDVEQRIDPILDEAVENSIALLVIGDPFGATTHADLVLRARGKGIKVNVIHNASIITAVGELGLELYRYGRTVSIPFWQPGYEPTSFLDGIKGNGDLHTLCLLDIRADEGRFMAVREAATLLLQAEERAKTGAVSPSRMALGVARLGWPDQHAKLAPLSELATTDLGTPPHCLILPGKLHPVEEDMLKIYH